MTELTESRFFTDDPRFQAHPLDEAFARHLEYSLVRDKRTVVPHDSFKALAMAIRERLIRDWLRTQEEYRRNGVKRVYYLSMEFLMGRLLRNILTNLGSYQECRLLLDDLGFSLEDLRELEPDMGLGNGGLGRLAACFLDSMATLGLPAFGYGIRYEFGIFRQTIEGGEQREQADNWLRAGNPWEVVRPELSYRVRFGGRVVNETSEDGRLEFRWVDTDDVLAVAHDTPVPGFRNGVVNNLRLWQAKATCDLDFSDFNRGDYMAAVEAKNRSENISKVLYPNDAFHDGRVLRLKQEYFLVSASIRDLLRQFEEQHGTAWELLPEKVAVQLNDTHPALGIPELMRILIDEHELDWEPAWEITRGTFAYTNHTLMPEALERWPLNMLEELLPRHLQIIYEINQQFLDQVREDDAAGVEGLRRVSIIGDGPDKDVRMANLSVIGSHTVNGVSALHTDILRDTLLADFNRIFPDKIVNVTNGITPRRWLLDANPLLAELIMDRIGAEVATDLTQMRKLEGLLGDESFKQDWRNSKWVSKIELARQIEAELGIEIDPESIFDVQIKRIHEYKRQLLNVLHVVTLYRRIKDNPDVDVVPRTVVISGKAAPAYGMAKLFIRLINGVADVVNNDPDVDGRLKLVFLPDYSVSLAMKIIPASDLSEQISTAGYEASGTGNMKLALNGALTIGTLDGANVEMAEAIGEENLFLFGLTADEVASLRPSYDPYAIYEANVELKGVLDMIAGEIFCPGNAGLFQPIFDALVHHGDPFFVLADYGAYIEAQDRVARCFLDSDRWTRLSILNAARMGHFSSDRTVAEYASRVWKVAPLERAASAPVARPARGYDAERGVHRRSSIG
jgi:starch phosphorylase